MSNESPIKRGWFQPPFTARAHYFNGSLSALCGGLRSNNRWEQETAVYDLNDEHPNNCARCKKLRGTSSFPRTEASND